jgi:hypothetical protein
MPRGVYVRKKRMEIVTPPPDPVRVHCVECRWWEMDSSMQIGLCHEGAPFPRTKPQFWCSKGRKV